MWILKLKFGFNNLGFEIRIHRKIRPPQVSYNGQHGTRTDECSDVFSNRHIEKRRHFLVKQASKIKFSLRQLQLWRDLQVSLSQVLSRFIKILTWTVWNSILLCFPQWTNECDFFEKYFHFVLKMPYHKYQVIIRQITPFLITLSFNSSSLSLRLFNLLMIYGSSSHFRSANDNVRKYVGTLIP